MKIFSLITHIVHVASLAQGQTYDCHHASDVNLKNMGEISHYLTATEQNKAPILCINIANITLFLYS